MDRKTVVFVGLALVCFLHTTHSCSVIDLRNWKCISLKEGANVTLRCPVESSNKNETFTLKWYKDKGDEVRGEGKRCVTIYNAERSDQGEYYCVVEYENYTMTSNHVTVRLLEDDSHPSPPQEGLADNKFGMSLGDHQSTSSPETEEDGKQTRDVNVNYKWDKSSGSLETPCPGWVCSRPASLATNDSSEPRDVSCRNNSTWPVSLANGVWTTDGRKCVVCGKSGYKPSELKTARDFLTNSGDYPWSAAVFVISKEKQWTQACEGTLISPSLVLSAANCLTSGNGRSPSPDNVRVGFGVEPKFDEINGKEESSAVSKVKDINFSPIELDLSLLVLHHDITTSFDKLPVCLDWSLMIPNIRPFVGFVTHYKPAYEGSHYVQYINLAIARSLQQSDKFEDKIYMQRFDGQPANITHTGSGIVYPNLSIYYLRGVIRTVLGNDGLYQESLFSDLLDRNAIDWLKSEWGKLDSTGTAGNSWESSSDPNDGTAAHGTSRPTPSATTLATTTTRTTTTSQTTTTTRTTTTTPPPTTTKPPTTKTTKGRGVQHQLIHKNAEKRSNISLPCSSMGQWYKQDTLGKTRVTLDPWVSKDGSLHFTNLTEGHEGIYFCAQAGQEATDKFYLKIVDSNNTVNISGNYSYQQGDTLRLSCTVKGSEMPYFVWYHSKHRFDYRTLNSTGNKYQTDFIIHNVKKDVHEGIYYCKLYGRNEANHQYISIQQSESSYQNSTTAIPYWRG